MASYLNYNRSCKIDGDVADLIKEVIKTVGAMLPGNHKGARKAKSEQKRQLKLREGIEATPTPKDAVGRGETKSSK